MIDAYEIGIQLALQDGVSAGLAVITRELAEVDRAVAASSAGLVALQETADRTVRAVAAAVGTRAPDPIAAPAAEEPVLPTAALRPLPAQERQPESALPDTRAERPMVQPAAASPARVEQPRGETAPASTAATENVDHGAAPVVERREEASARSMPARQSAETAAPVSNPIVAAEPAPDTAAPVAATRVQPSVTIVQSISTPARADVPRRDAGRLASAAAQVVSTRVGSAAPPAAEAPGPTRVDREHTEVVPPVVVRAAVSAAMRPRATFVADTTTSAPVRTNWEWGPTQGAVAPETQARPSPALPTGRHAVERAAAPQPPPQEREQSGGGSVILDGRLVGHWLTEQMAREASRPPGGTSFFDPRRAPAWTPSGAL